MAVIKHQLNMGGQPGSPLHGARSYRFSSAAGDSSTGLEQYDSNGSGHGGKGVGGCWLWCCLAG